MAFLPEATTVTIGGHKDVRDLVYGLAELSGSGSGCTFYESHSGAAYQVPSGKTLRIVGLRLNPTGSGSFKLVYSDNSVGYNTVTAFTNKVTCYGTDGKLMLNQETLYRLIDFSISFDVPTGKYPGVEAGTFSGVITMVGYLY